MNDQELRELVRAAVARHIGQQGSGSGTQVQAPGSQMRAMQSTPYPTTGTRTPVPDASHFVYVALTNASTQCVIEPDVPCNHCNYCKSHGH